MSCLILKCPFVRCPILTESSPVSYQQCVVMYFVIICFRVLFCLVLFAPMSKTKGLRCLVLKFDVLFYLILFKGKPFASPTRGDRCALKCYNLLYFDLLFYVLLFYVLLFYALLICHHWQRERLEVLYNIIFCVIILCYFKYLYILFFSIYFIYKEPFKPFTPSMKCNVL